MQTVIIYGTKDTSKSWNGTEWVDGHHPVHINDVMVLPQDQQIMIKGQREGTRKVDMTVANMQTLQATSKYNMESDAIWNGFTSRGVLKLSAIDEAIVWMRDQALTADSGMNDKGHDHAMMSMVGEGICNKIFNAEDFGYFSQKLSAITVNVGKITIDPDRINMTMKDAFILDVIYPSGYPEEVEEGEYYCDFHVYESCSAWALNKAVYELTKPRGEQ